jgi:bacterioferritin-associated ferredoxin
MIVCHCFCVSDREIRGCAREGACSVSEVGRSCGAGTGCGGCRPEIASILEREQGESASATQHFTLPVLQQTG